MFKRFIPLALLAAGLLFTPARMTASPGPCAQQARIMRDIHQQLRVERMRMMREHRRALREARAWRRYVRGPRMI